MRGTECVRATRWDGGWQFGGTDPVAGVKRVERSHGQGHSWCISAQCVSNSSLHCLACMPCAMYSRGTCAMYSKGETIVVVVCGAVHWQTSDLVDDVTRGTGRLLRTRTSIPVDRVQHFLNLLPNSSLSGLYAFAMYAERTFRCTRGNQCVWETMWHGIGLGVGGELFFVAEQIHSSSKPFHGPHKREGAVARGQDQGHSVECLLNVFEFLAFWLVCLVRVVGAEKW